MLIFYIILSIYVKVYDRYKVAYPKENLTTIVDLSKKKDNMIFAFLLDEEIRSIRDMVDLVTNSETLYDRVEFYLTTGDDIDEGGFEGEHVMYSIKKGEILGIHKLPKDLKVIPRLFDLYSEERDMVHSEKGTLYTSLLLAEYSLVTIAKEYQKVKMFAVNASNELGFVNVEVVTEALMKQLSPKSVGNKYLFYRASDGDLSPTDLDLDLIINNSHPSFNYLSDKELGSEKPIFYIYSRAGSEDLYDILYGAAYKIKDFRFVWIDDLSKSNFSFVKIVPPVDAGLFDTTKGLMYDIHDMVVEAGLVDSSLSIGKWLGFIKGIHEKYTSNSLKATKMSEILGRESEHFKKLSLETYNAFVEDRKYDRIVLYHRSSDDISASAIKYYQSIFNDLREGGIFDLVGGHINILANHVPDYVRELPEFPCTQYLGKNGEVQYFFGVKNKDHLLTWLSKTLGRKLDVEYEASGPDELYDDIKQAFDAYESTEKGRDLLVKFIKDTFELAQALGLDEESVQDVREWLEENDSKEETMKQEL